MSVITLISDWQPNSIYLSVVKGAIFSKSPDTKVVDISHSIDPFNINQAAFIVKNTFKNFPEKSVHLICVSSETNSTEGYLIIEYENQYFIGNDNGIFGLIFDKKPSRIINISSDLLVETTFPELTIFTDFALKIINNEDIANFGELVTSYKKMFPLSATFEDDVIIGKVIYIDAYKNVVTNISLELFNQIGRGRKFAIYIKSNRNKIEKINKKYSESSEGEILAVFNTLGLLEIAQNKGSIADLLAIDKDSVIRINFIN
jgi:S-adenosylmethionine hydrolase